MKTYICKCEVCKAERAKAQQARKQATARVAEMQAFDRTMRSLGLRVEQLRRSTGMELWTCHDGHRVPVNDMDDAHLFFAIAKAHRMEYPDSQSRKAGIAALRKEALRRLLWEM